VINQDANVITKPDTMAPPTVRKDAEKLPLKLNDSLSLFKVSIIEIITIIELRSIIEALKLALKTPDLI
jgi:hypothetical protein